MTRGARPDIPPDLPLTSRPGIRIGKWILRLLCIALACFLLQPIFLWTRAWWRDRPAAEVVAEGRLGDASRNNPVTVAGVWRAPADPAKAEEGLREFLAEARAKGLSVTTGSIRHSQGGQALCRDGCQLDLSALRHVRVEADRLSAWIGAGATWAQVLPELDRLGLSVRVMQSNHDFSVGGSLGVNAHGWQAGSPPIASTVLELRLMNADGEVIRASPSENTEWFRHALGGYGLFGVILEARLAVTANRLVRPIRETVAAEDYPAHYKRRMSESPETVLAYGRLSLAPASFLRQAALTRYVAVDGVCPPLHPEPPDPFRRAVYRAQIGSDAGKTWRWRLEKWAGENLHAEAVSRNQLLHEPSAVYRERNADRVDLLQEYFVPGEGFPVFLDKARGLLRGRPTDLLNVTLREVRRDEVTALPYASRDVFGFVMLFNLSREAAALVDFDELSSRLAAAAMEAGGRHYLCYRTLVPSEIFLAAYPHAPDFFAAKHRLDPSGLFQNEWYRGLGAPITGTFSAPADFTHPAIANQRPIVSPSDRAKD